MKITVWKRTLVANDTTGGGSGSGSATGRDDSAKRGAKAAGTAPASPMSQS